MLNINLGLFGHVDSGKTSIAKSISSLSSTACFDKHMHSQERGITIDLGFSALIKDSPLHIASQGYSSIQFTIVDCPGHADFIRTILGGGQIIDIMVLVIDAAKGMQVQTSECIVIGEIIEAPLIVLLNKADLFSHERDSLIAIKKQISSILKKTRWANPTIIPISTQATSVFFKEGFYALQECLLSFADKVIVKRGQKAKLTEKMKGDQGFVMLADHCFNIKGKGSIFTGTITQGSVQLNTLVNIPAYSIQRKVKSIQAFHTQVQEAGFGDRIGICLKDISCAQIERTLICSPDVTVPFVYSFVAQIYSVRFFTKDIRSNELYHMSIGHETVIAQAKFFYSQDGTFSFKRDYLFLDKLPDCAKAFYDDKGDLKEPTSRYFAHLTLKVKVHIPPNIPIICSKLDRSVNIKACRIAFHGKIVGLCDVQSSIKLTLFKTKYKQLSIDRWTDDSNCICSGLNKHNVQNFVKKSIVLIIQDKGVDESEKVYHGTLIKSFGQSGKILAHLNVPERVRSLPKVAYELKVPIQKLMHV